MDLSHSKCCHLVCVCVCVFCSWSDYDDGDGNGCEYAGAVNDQSWYMGLAPCYRANAAYSLYGVLKGEKDTGCNAKTFINSFFTTRGVQTFTEYMEYAGNTFSSGNNNDDDAYAGGVSAACEAVQSDDYNGYDDAYAYQHNANLGKGYTSYGVGCSADGEYVEKTFQGQYCSESAKSRVTDSLSTFNQEMAGISCQSIFSSSGNEENDGGAPVELLTFSQSCSVLEYPGACPDPHGKLLKYERSLEDSTGFVHNKRKERVRKIMTWIMVLVGLLLITVSLISYFSKKKAKKVEPEKKPTFWQRITSSFRRRDRKTSSNTKNSSRK